MIQRFIVALALLATPALSQETGIAFGPFRQDPNEPVEVTSERLEVNQNAGAATFIGDVVVVQGEMRLTAPRIRIEYAAGDGEAGGIDTMHATGGVTMLSGEHAAEAEQAVYSVDGGTVEMSGDVIVTQGPSVLSGQRLFVDLDTGIGTMEGRVRTIFQQDDQ